VLPSKAQLEKDKALFDSCRNIGSNFWIVCSVLLVFGLVGLMTWLYQLKMGLVVTGLNIPVYWGFYVVNFVFFIGISYAGTLISAILRICQAEWRRPITRAAETIAVLVLLFGIGNIMLDLGRPDRALNIIFFSNMESPLVWDMISITCYFMMCAFYLYVPMIPDMAIMRDHYGKWRPFYRLLALGFTGTERQVRILNRVISWTSVIIIPIAVTVHSVVAYVFALTVNPSWHSTIFGPYFVLGAIYSGTALLIVVLVMIRHFYKLHHYLKPIHFNYISMILVAFSFLWIYFTFTEYITTYYGQSPDHMPVFWSKMTGSFSFLFWLMIVCCFVIPMSLLLFKRTRTIRNSVIASLAIIVGMWIERYLIVIPEMVRSRLPYPRGVYHPSWVEISMFVSFLALFALLYLLFTKIFPIISIWEIHEGRLLSLKEVTGRVKSYLPTEREGDCPPLEVTS
jgi:molybdopterin-containing oxidoreductase family membrane subunit